MTIALGQRHLHLVEQHLEDGVPGGGGLLEPLAAAEPLADVVAQLGHGVELRGLLGEVVVELGELLLLDLLDGHLDLDVLADQVAADELGREGLLVAGGHAEQRVVEAVDHAAAADLVAHAGQLGAVDDLAVAGRGQVDDHEVAVGRRPLDVGEGGEPLAQRLDLLLDVGVGDLEVLDLGLEALVVGQRDLGLHVHLGGELQPLLTVLGDLDLGLGQRLQGVGLERLHVLLRAAGR